MIKDSPFYGLAANSQIQAQDPAGSHQEQNPRGILKLMCKNIKPQGSPGLSEVFPNCLLKESSVLLSRPTGAKKIMMSFQDLPISSYYLTNQ